MRTWVTAASSLLIALLVLVPSAMTFADPLDYDIAGGHFYSQTNGQNGAGGAGYAVTDDATAKFWSEFKRLGGVDAVGYPVSHRFMWDGFVVQAFQKAVFQWRPEAGQVYFVNVFDRLGQAGKDEWLEAARATPASFDHSADQGLAWNDVVKRHVAFLDANPAIKAKYLAASDPVQSYGLPMSYKDYGNVFVVRAQRAVFQQWKQDVPWAKAGQVVVANGGDVAKEAGMYPANAILPETAAIAAAHGASTTSTAQPAASPTPAVTAGIQWAVHEDGEKRFKHPSDWVGIAFKNGANFYVEPEGRALIEYLAPFGMGSGYKLEDFLTEVTHYMAGGGDIVITQRQSTTINGHVTDLAWFETKGSDPIKGIFATIQSGRWVYYIGGLTVSSEWSTYEPVFMEVIQSYVPKGN